MLPKNQDTTHQKHQSQNFRRRRRLCSREGGVGVFSIWCSSCACGSLAQARLQPWHCQLRCGRPVRCRCHLELGDHDVFLVGLAATSADEWPGSGQADGVWRWCWCLCWAWQPLLGLRWSSYGCSPHCMQGPKVRTLVIADWDQGLCLFHLQVRHTDSRICD